MRLLSLKDSLSYPECDGSLCSPRVQGMLPLIGVCSPVTFIPTEAICTSENWEHVKHQNNSTAWYFHRAEMILSLMFNTFELWGSVS